MIELLKKRGFTLIEVLAALILLGLLVVITISSIAFLTKQKDSEIDDIKITNLKSSLEFYMDGKGKEYKERRSYGYCIPVSTVIKETKYTEKDFLELFGVSDVKLKSVNIEFENESNFDIEIIDTSTCTTGKREENIGILKSFGGSGWDIIDDMVAQGDNYYIVGNTDSTTGDFSSITSIKGGMDSFIAKVDKNFTVLEMDFFSGLGIEAFEHISIIDNNIYVLGRGGEDSKTVGYVESDVKQVFGSPVDYHDNDYLIFVKYDLELKRIQTEYIPKVVNGLEKIIKTKSGFIVYDNFSIGDNPTLTPVGGTDVVITKIGLSGKINYIKTLGSTGNDVIENLVIDDYENMYLNLTNVNRTNDFVTLAPVKAGAYNSVVVKITKSGETEYIKAYGEGGTSSTVHKIGVANNVLFVAGISNNKADLFTGKCPNDCLFIFKLDKTGNITKNYIVNDTSSTNSFFESILIAKAGIYVDMNTHKEANFSYLNEDKFIVSDNHKNSQLSSSLLLPVNNKSREIAIFDWQRRATIRFNHDLEIVNYHLNENTMHLYNSEDTNLYDSYDGIVRVYLKKYVASTGTCDIGIVKYPYDLSSMEEKKLTNTCPTADGVLNLKFYNFDSTKIITFTTRDYGNDFATVPANGDWDTVIVNITK